MAKVEVKSVECEILMVKMVVDGTLTVHRVLAFFYMTWYLKIFIYFKIKLKKYFDKKNIIAYESLENSIRKN